MSKVTRAVPRDVGLSADEQRRIAQCATPGDVLATMAWLRARGASRQLVELARTLGVDAILGDFWSANPEMTFFEVLSAKGWMAHAWDLLPAGAENPLGRPAPHRRTVAAS